MKHPRRILNEDCSISPGGGDYEVGDKVKVYVPGATRGLQQGTVARVCKMSLLIAPSHPASSPIGLGHPRFKEVDGVICYYVPLGDVYLDKTEPAPVVNRFPTECWRCKWEGVLAEGEPCPLCLKTDQLHEDEEGE